MQSSIFDLPINSTFGDLPTAIIEPKPENWYVVADKPTAAPRASPEFAIGAIVQSLKYFKKLSGEIIGFEQFGGIDFAILRYRWYDSVIDYPAIASSLIPVQETTLLIEEFPLEISSEVEQEVDQVSFPPAEVSQLISSEVEQEVDQVSFPPAEVSQLKIGDRVKVLEHQFMCDRTGTIQKLDGEMATVDFGATENLWCIGTRRLAKIDH